MARKPYQALRHRDYALLATANLVSLTGSQMQVVAINWHVYLLTGSALKLGLVGLTRVIPIILFSLWGGVAADRFDRRKVMFVAQVVMTLVATAFAVITFSRHESLWLIYLLSALSAAATAFDNPARQALIPRLVPREELPAAMAMNLTFFNIAFIGGPALAGLLIAGTGAGLHPSALALHRTGAPGDPRGLWWIYALNAVSFLGVIVSLIIMRTSGKVAPGEGREHPGFVTSLRDGLKFVASVPVMVWTMGLDFFATFFAGAMSLLPIFADKILGASAVGYGWLVSAPALGALLGSLYTSLYPLPKKQGRVILWAVAGYGAATIVFGLSRIYWLTFVALAATGLCDAVSTVIRQTLRQMLTPDALRGRMTAVNMIFFMGGPQLGEFEAGLVASLFAAVATGAMVSVVAGGVATLVVAGLIAGLTPVVRNYEPAA